jgi:hypothetical protein
MKSVNIDELIDGVVVGFTSLVYDRGYILKVFISMKT